jgi:hypothetical protein
VKTGALRRLLSVTLAAGLMALPSSASACAACFGKSDDALARGMNMGIFTLLIVITSVLIGLASFFIFLARRSARFAAQTADANGSASSDAEVPASISQTTP